LGVLTILNNVLFSYEERLHIKMHIVQSMSVYSYVNEDNNND